MTDYDATYTCPICGAQVGPDEIQHAHDGQGTIVGCDRCPDKIVKLDDDDWK